MEHPGPRKFLEPGSFAGQNVRDQTEPVPGGQAGYRPCVLVGDASQFMRRDDVLQELQLRLRQVTPRRELAEGFRYPGEGVAARWILVDRAHGLVACRDGSLHRVGCEPASAQRAVRGREVLPGAEAVAAEHDRAVHVEQHDGEAGQVGR